MLVANCLFTLVDIIYIMRNSWANKNWRWRINATKLHNKMFDFGYLLKVFCCDKKDGVPFAMALPFDSSFPETIRLQLMLDK